jgi:hypothetical protein
MGKNGKFWEIGRPWTDPHIVDSFTFGYFCPPGQRRRFFVRWASVGDLPPFQVLLARTKNSPQICQILSDLSDLRIWVSVTHL